jgi:hypothetical protein
LLAGAAASSAIFFLISNFGCWLVTYFLQNFGGSMQCYAAGILIVKRNIFGRFVL